MKGNDMRNTSLDLNNHLFEQLERLTDDSLDLNEEVKRASAITKVAEQIVSNAKLALDAEKLKALDPDANVPRMISDGR